MDAKEYRLGNLLQDKVIGNILQVCLIEYDRFECKGYQSSSYPRTLMNHVERIPITEDNLVNLLEFEQNDLTKSEYNFTRFKVSVIEHGFMFSDYHWGASKKVKYVHQIQNLLIDLTDDEELEIKG